MRCHVTGLVLGLMLHTSLAAAAPSPGLELRIEGALPFQRQDLIDLVRLRLPSQSGGLRAVVRAQGNRVRIQVGEKSRETVVAPDAGLAGARLVALLLVDMAAEEQMAGTVRSSTRVEAKAPVPPSGPPRFWLALNADYTSLTHGEVKGSVEASAELDVRLHRLLLGFLQVGYCWTQPENMVGAVDRLETEFQEIPIRLGLGLRWKWLELRAAALVRIHFAWAHYWDWSDGGNGSSTVNDIGARPGGSLGLTLHLPLGRRVSLRVNGGVDLLATTDEYYSGYAYAPVLATNWVVPWVGLGLAYGWGE